MKHYVFAIAASMAWVGGVQAGAVSTVRVKNSTDTEATFTYDHFLGSVRPQPGVLDPRSMGEFTVTSPSDIVSGMRFVYTSKDKACRFSASHSVNPGNNVPAFNKRGESIGRSRAICNATFTDIKPVMPYPYTVEFEIR